MCHLYVSVLLFDWGCLFIMQHSYSLSLIIGSVLNLDSGPLAGLVNRSVAGLHSPGLIGVNVICNKDLYASVFIS